MMDAKDNINVALSLSRYLRTDINHENATNSCVIQYNLSRFA